MSDDQAPIYSTLDLDPSVRDAINDFVIRLAEDVDLLQDAESEDDLPRVAKLAGSLSAEATKLGYPVLADIATRVADACALTAPDEARTALMDLTEVAYRVRLGHRGAA